AEVGYNTYHRRLVAYRVLVLPAAVAQDLYYQLDQLADLHHVLSLLAPPSPERRAAEPCEAAPTLNTMKDQTVQELRIEVRRLLRQHFAAAHDRLQLRERGRGDEERRLIAPGARQAHQIGRASCREGAEGGG